jgi:hypothetical protein
MQIAAMEILNTLYPRAFKGVGAGAAGGDAKLRENILLTAHLHLQLHVPDFNSELAILFDGTRFYEGIPSDSSPVVAPIPSRPRRFNECVCGDFLGYTLSHQ